MDEFWIGENLIAFDGRVVEVFGHPALAAVEPAIDAILAAVPA